MNLSTEELIHRHFDGVLSDPEFSELNHRLKSEDTATILFAKCAQLHHALEDGYTTGSLEHRTGESYLEEANTEVPQKTHFLWSGASWSALAATVAILASAWFFLKKINSTPEIVKPSTELHDSGYAVLTRVVDAQWSRNPPLQGDFLAAGDFTLHSGLAQIEFLSGVSLVVEGDASFKIISSEEMHLHHGKLRAHVPPHAVGFQIHTPQGTALDLGTEFALELNEENCELHVLNGEVEWHPKDDVETLVTGGKGLRFSEGKPSSIPANPARFTSVNQLATHLASRQEEKFSAWKKHQTTFSQRHDLIAHFPFNNLGLRSRQLKGSLTHHPIGSVVAAEKVAGRWPGKTALDFSPNGSRVRVTIPGEYEQITFATWVRIDSLDRQYNALFLADNYEAGEPHWQLTSDGRLFFSIRLDNYSKESGKHLLHHIHYSDPVWDHSRSQQWLHLVTTYDCVTRTAVHYLNGEEMNRDQAPLHKRVSKIHIGDAQIGNWGLPTKTEPDFAVRNLNGRLDEFSIFSSALSAREVQSLYQAGNP